MSQASQIHCCKEHYLTSVNNPFFLQRHHHLLIKRVLDLLNQNKSSRGLGRKPPLHQLLECHLHKTRLHNLLKHGMHHIVAGASPKRPFAAIALVFTILPKRFVFFTLHPLTGTTWRRKHVLKLASRFQQLTNGTTGLVVLRPMKLMQKVSHPMSARNEFNGSHRRGKRPSSCLGLTHH